MIGGKTPKGKYAWTVRIGEKGQFVIPKQARDMFDIHPGDTIMVLADENKGIAIPSKAVTDFMMKHLFSNSFGEIRESDEETED